MKEQLSLVEKILSEENCGKGMYWCNTNKECKPLPTGFNVPGQKIKPTEVGIGKPVEGSCNHTKKGKTCPVHGKSPCPVDEACWNGYKKVGMKKKGNKIVPNCVPEETKIQEASKSGDDWHPDPEIDRKLGGTGANQRAREDHPQPKSDSKKLRPGESYMDWNERQRGLKNSYEPDGELIDESTRLQAETGNILAVILNWRGKTYSIRMFFPQIGMPSRKDVTTEIQKIYPGSQVLQYKVSTIEPGMPLIQVVNSKSKNYLLNSKTIGEEVEIEEDWQKENRKDKTDGLSQKAVNAYRRENPGSNLQTAVTEKKPTGKRASRRKNFCSRMSGMKSKLTSTKTARDPDSRINKALRRWNCN